MSKVGRQKCQKCHIRSDEQIEQMVRSDQIRSDQIRSDSRKEQRHRKESQKVTEILYTRGRRRYNVDSLELVRALK